MRVRSSALQLTVLLLAAVALGMGVAVAVDHPSTEPRAGVAAAGTSAVEAVAPAAARVEPLADQLSSRWLRSPLVLAVLLVAVAAALAAAWRAAVAPWAPDRRAALVRVVAPSRAPPRHR